MTPVVRQRGMLPTAKLPTICALLLAVIIGSSNAVPPCRTDELHASTEDRLNPFSAQWDNSIAICALMRAENSQDVREFLQYHRCERVALVATTGERFDPRRYSCKCRACYQRGSSPHKFQNDVHSARHGEFQTNTTTGRSLRGGKLPLAIPTAQRCHMATGCSVAPVLSCLWHKFLRYAG